MIIESVNWTVIFRFECVCVCVAFDRNAATAAT